MDRWKIAVFPLLLLTGSFFSGCLPTGQADIRSQAAAPQTENIAYEKTVNLNDEVDISFRLRDYKDVPDNYTSLSDIEKYLIDLSGKASFKVKEFGHMDEADGASAISGMTFYYAVFEFKGDQMNPFGDTIHPDTIQQTGWDPAPQLVLIINDKPFYQNAYRTEVSRAKKIPIQYNVDVNQKDWITDVATWIQSKSAQPTLALKYVDTQGNIKYVKINYSSDIPTPSQ